MCVGVWVCGGGGQGDGLVARNGFFPRVPRKLWAPLCEQLPNAYSTFCRLLLENMLSLTPTSNSLTQQYIHFIQSTFTGVSTQPLALKCIL